jgi:hypothetical protein
LRLLYIYRKTNVIILETLFNRLQMIYEQYDKVFEEFLSLAEQVVHGPQLVKLMIFYDAGVTGPLFLVAHKCRNLGLRRKALYLIRLAPLREGMWNRQHVVEFVEWKIGIEERGRGQLFETETLPEEARIWNEHVETALIDGRQRTVVSFQWQSKHCVKYGKDITDLNPRSPIPQPLEKVFQRQTGGSHFQRHI